MIDRWCWLPHTFRNDEQSLIFDPRSSTFDPPIPRPFVLKGPLSPNCRHETHRILAQFVEGQSRGA